MLEPTSPTRPRELTITNEPVQWKGDPVIVVDQPTGAEARELHLVTNTARPSAAAGTETTSFFGTDQVAERTSWQEATLACKDGRPLGRGERVTGIHVVSTDKRQKLNEDGSRGDDKKQKKMRPLNQDGSSGHGYVWVHRRNPLGHDGQPQETTLDHLLATFLISVDNGDFEPVSHGELLELVDTVWHRKASVSVRVKYTKTTDYILKLRFTVSGFDSAAAAVAAAPGAGAGPASTSSAGDVVLYTAGIVVLSALTHYDGGLCLAKKMRKLKGGGKKRRPSEEADAKQPPLKKHAAAGGGAAPRPAAAGGGTTPRPGAPPADLHSSFHRSTACPPDFDSLPGDRKNYLYGEWAAAELYPYPPLAATGGGGAAPPSGGGAGGGCAAPATAPPPDGWSQDDDDDFAQAVHDSWTQENQDALLSLDITGADTGTAAVSADFAALALAPAPPAPAPAPAPAPLAPPPASAAAAAAAAAPAFLSLGMLLGDLPHLLLLLPQLPQWAQSAVRHQVTAAGSPAWFNTANLKLNL
jgi:hypothetical protein